MTIGTADRNPALSPRELEVLQHLARGCTYAAIAHRMGLSTHTVDTYLRRIRAKTGADNRIRLALLAAEVSTPTMETSI
ncbi:response regulator transcription factor [Streptacidiphilus albus]|uniref:response regulator transcription factor n=1 Tax=Streptacidiphilus albus TaxID=105425 RepID=UPI0009DED142|nr:helix-turn-helix transcriptional regulator [Streptacidiphilus albus]